MRKLIIKEEFQIPGTEIILEEGDSIRLTENDDMLDPTIFATYVANIKSWIAKTYKVSSSAISDSGTKYGNSTEIYASFSINKNSWEGFFSTISLEVHAYELQGRLTGSISLNFTPVHKSNIGSTGMIVGDIAGDSRTGVLWK